MLAEKEKHKEIHAEMIQELLGIESKIGLMKDKFKEIGEALEKEVPNQTFYDTYRMPGFEELSDEEVKLYKELIGDDYYEILYLQNKIYNALNDFMDVVETKDALVCKLSKEVTIRKKEKDL